MAKVTKKAPKVVEEVVEEVQEEIMEETESVDEVAQPDIVYSDEFSYTVKAGKGTFPNMSDMDVMQFIDATLGKVDKIEIIRK